MGCAFSSALSPAKAPFRLIPDQYQTYKDLSAALHKVGFENCDVVLAVDFTASNKENGQVTFGGKDLHWVPPADAKKEQPGEQEGVKKEDERQWNPYRRVLACMGAALETLNPARRIMCLGFGDMHTEDHSVFCMKKRAGGQEERAVVADLKQCEPCIGAAEVMNVYMNAVSRTIRSGPTSFVPILKVVGDHVAKSGRFCFVFIVGDGQVSKRAPNAQAIVAASALPLSVSMIGVGDGPWKTMEEFDDELPDRRFDNWQFVDFEQTMKECGNNPLRFATHSLMELPEQLASIKSLKLL